MRAKIKRYSPYLQLLVMTVVSLLLAAAAPHGRPHWFLVVPEQPPGLLGPFPTERDCAQELERRRALAEISWRRAVIDYYQLLSIAVAPPTDTAQAERVAAYRRTLYYQRIFSLYRAATCEPRN